MCTVFVAVIPLLPPIELRAMEKVDISCADNAVAAPNSSAVNSKGAVKHLWELVNDRWLCRTCLSNTRGASLSDKRANESCEGRADSCSTIGNSLGHFVKEFQCVGEPLFVHNACGGSGTRNDICKLEERCTTPTT